MNKEFSDAFSTALKPAGAVQKLFERIDLTNNTAFFEDDKTFHRLNLMAVTRAKIGLEQSINALGLLENQVRSGIRPSGVRCGTISEELFHEACKTGDVKLAGYAMADCVSIPVIEKLQEIFGILLIYASDIEDTARFRAKQAAVIDQVPATEIETRPAAST